MKKIIFASIAFLLLFGVYSQNDSIVSSSSTKTKKIALSEKIDVKDIYDKWNIPSRKWFIEIGTPGLGLSLSSNPIGSVVENINLTNGCVKFPSVTLYKLSTIDTTDVFAYWGYGLEYQVITGSFKMKDRVAGVSSSLYTDDFVNWSLTSIKYKYRTLARLTKEFSMSFGVGFSYNKSFFSEYIAYDNTDPNVYYKFDKKTTESNTFAMDIGVVWEVTKWFNLGLRYDFDIFKIKLENWTMWGKYNSYSTIYFHTFSPTVRFKL